jgi:hypothetical protein
VSRPIIDIEYLTAEINDIQPEPEPETGYAQRHGYHQVFTLRIGVRRYADVSDADIATTIVGLLEGRTQAEIAQLVYDTTLRVLNAPAASGDGQGVLL